MKTQARLPDTGKVHGDEGAIPRTNGSTEVGYDYSKSMPGCSKEHLKQDATYSTGGIGGETKSDRIDRGARRPSDRI